MPETEFEFEFINQTSNFRTSFNNSKIYTLMMPRITQHFTIKVGTMSIGKHSDADFLQTQDCILLWTADVDL